MFSTSVLLCIYMHRIKWILIAKQSVCLVDPMSMLLSRLLSQILSQLLSQLRSQRRSHPYLEHVWSYRDVDREKTCFGGHERELERENTRFCGPGRTLDRENTRFCGPGRTLDRENTRFWWIRAYVVILKRKGGRAKRRVHLYI